MISSSAALAFNHLLAQQPAQRERLAALAGLRFALSSLPLPPVRLAVLPAGNVEVAADSEAPEVTLEINPLALPLLMARSRQVFPYIKLSVASPQGQALGEALRELLIELRWDFEEDLSRVVGDVAAHRVAQTGRDAAAWQREALERLAQNFSEYWTEERPLLARRADFEAFTRDIADLRSALERVEARAGDLQG